MIWSPGMPAVSCATCAMAWYKGRSQDEINTCDKCHSRIPQTESTVSITLIKEGKPLPCGHASAPLQIIAGICNGCADEARKEAK